MSSIIVTGIATQQSAGLAGSQAVGPMVVIAAAVFLLISWFLEAYPDRDGRFASLKAGTVAASLRRNLQIPVAGLLAAALASFAIATAELIGA